jgi:hypothetical protein
MFPGSAMWHLRERPAGTLMLYLKLNTFNCDPLGEDPYTEGVEGRTRQLLSLPDEELGNLVPLVGRRVDYFHRRYGRDWQELLGVVMSGGPHLTIDDHELRALQAVDGRRSLRGVVLEMGESLPSESAYARLRRLAGLGILDLVPRPARAAVPASRGMESTAHVVV